MQVHKGSGRHVDDIGHDRRTTVGETVHGGWLGQRICPQIQSHLVPLGAAVVAWIDAQVAVSRACTRVTVDF